MKKLFYTLLLIISCLSLASCEFSFENILGGGNNVETSPNIPVARPKAPKGVVNFAMINDTHGAFDDSIDGNSIAKVDTVIDDLEAKKGLFVKIANGDILQGSYISSKYYGRQMIESLNEMSFDCFVIGNHEFDWGLDKVAAYSDGIESNGEAEFPFLGANIYYANTTIRPDWIKPYTVIEYGDINVGVIGVIGGYQESSILAENVSAYTFVDNPISLIKSYALELRRSEDCDVVVVASHDYDELLIDDISNLGGDGRIDAVFCGHTHQLIKTSITRVDGMEIPVVQNYDKNDTVMEINIKLDSNNKMNGYNSYYHYTKYVDKSSDFDYLFNKYRDDLNNSEEVIGYTMFGLNKSTLGKYATNSMLEFDYSSYGYDHIDISILNTGGVRSTIPSGNITNASVYNVFPFDNKVVLVKMKGSMIKSMLTRNEEFLYIGYNNLASYSNLDNNKTYTIAVIDYVFTGSYYSEFQQLSSSNYVETDLLMRDLLIEYIKKTH